MARINRQRIDKVRFMHFKIMILSFFSFFLSSSSFAKIDSFNLQSFEWTKEELKTEDDSEETNDFSWDTPLPLIAAYHLSTMSDEELDSDWKLNDFFGSIITINLPRSKERLEFIKNELKAINTKSFTIFPAIDGRTELPPWIVERFTHNRENYDIRTEEGRASLQRLKEGQAGCYMSHYINLQKINLAFDEALSNLTKVIDSNNQELIQKAKQELKKYSRVLILEDDARFGFINESGEIYTTFAGRILREAILDLPENWDILYFVIHAAAPTTQIAPHLYKIGRSWSQSAYAVNHSMYKPLINFLSAVENTARPVAEVDQMIAFLHQYFNVFAVYPALAFHKGNTSEICGSIKCPFWQEQPIFKQK